MRSLVVAMMIAGCGGGGIEAKDFGKQLQAALCEQQVRCGGVFPDVASCDDYYSVASVTTLLDEIGSGSVHYDADKAEECLNFYRNAPCDETSMEARTGDPACDEIVTGTRDVGAACAASEECQSKHCSTPTCNMACCPGTCVAATVLGKLGEPCATRNCESGLVCDNTKTCAMLYTEGMPCTGSDQCNYGLACDAFVGGFCRHAPQLGEACPDGVCADSGTYCSAAKICTQPGFAGAACTTAVECSFYYPCNTMTGVCEANPTVGQPCTTLCSDGSYCDSTSHVCTAKLADGGACTSPAACQSNYCNTTCMEQPVCD